jgi:alpha-tubulin suppressor-like RCC1 family protein
VIGLSGVKQVAAGGDILAGHSCAVLNNGEVWCWGSGVNGRLGNNANLDRYTPVKVQLPNGTLATQVSAGGHHTCAVDVAGKAWCWGEGLNGQLGNGLLLDRLTPTQVSFGAGVSITQISAGGAHTCAVDTKNRVWCWGANLDGQLGNNSILNRAVPVQVSNFSNAVQVSAGDEHTCAVLANGQVWCWGEGQNGRLCLNLLGDSLVPVQVPGVSNALQVSAGDDQTCARVIDAGSKKDLCWGGDSHGQLGNGENLDSSSAVPVARMCMPTAISAGDAFTCALASGSTGASVYAWGSNSSWQLGDGTSISRRATAPVANSSTASAVSCGSAHGCEIVAGQARCWGNNGSGRLGDGTTTNRSKPVAVSATDTYSMVATGDAHSCGIVSGGAVKCWGYGANGRLGNGSTANKLVPTSVTGLPGAASWIATGDAHSCAVVANGTNREVWCWGTGAYGRLGNNATNDALAPVKDTGISNALAVSAGALHTCATTTAAGVWCWGHGGNGRLGNGATANSNVPVPVQGTNGSTLVLSSASALAAGDDFSCVTGVGTNSQLACWGNNAFGTLGDGTNTSSARAKVVPGVANASAVTAADGHACAIIAGEAYCWGSNGDANLGDGTLLSRTSPRLVAVEACQ